MSRILLIDIPAPCGWINLNRRQHRMQVQALTRTWRTAARIACGVGKHEPFTSQVRITATVYKPRGGRWDVSNWLPTAKACVDGLVDAGLLVDDSNAHVLGPDMRAGTTGEPRIILTIEEVK
jgi:Holliday junction resolvase RusA-like endonuclease